MDRGYTGKILNVNLSTGDIREESIPDGVYERFLAGMGLGAYILHRDIPGTVLPSCLAQRASHRRWDKPPAAVC